MIYIYRYRYRSHDNSEPQSIHTSKPPTSRGDPGKNFFTGKDIAPVKLCRAFELRGAARFSPPLQAVKTCADAEAGTMLFLVFSLTSKGVAESDRIIDYAFACLGEVFGLAWLKVLAWRFGGVESTNSWCMGCRGAA